MSVSMPEVSTVDLMILLLHYEYGIKALVVDYWYTAEAAACVRHVASGQLPKVQSTDIQSIYGFCNG